MLLLDYTESGAALCSPDDPQQACSDHQHVRVLARPVGISETEAAPVAA